MLTGNATPIVVDLDGTLTPTDTLVESLVLLVRKSPLNGWRACVWLLKGRSCLKEDDVAVRVRPAIENPPYRQTLGDYVRAEKAKGRRVVLATAEHASIAKELAEDLACFDEVPASDRGRNLKGTATLDAIVHTVGKELVYAGDCRADLPIWREASASILVGVLPGLSATVRSMVAVEREFGREPVLATDWLCALRVHHWLKNLLLFVPVLATFSCLGEAS